MTHYEEPKWLTWAKEIQALAQQGLTYTKDKYELDRYRQLRDLSVEIMQNYTEAGEDKIRDLFAFERGYQTPKVDVRGAILRDDSILLVHEQIDGRWAMPGGWADVCLSVTDNIKKEAREEAGMTVEPYKLVGLFDWTRNIKKPFPYSIYKAVMLCRPEEWQFEKNIETLEADFFKRDSLPELSPGRTTRELIDLCFEARENPGYKPVVD
ncbi:MAG: NUDIX hydrolase [Eubacteriaceae bacterium]|jgi:ADP-ribose pyrophosphatase YjhB (NUDIX family)